MLSLVIGILTTMMLAAGVLTVLHMRRNRDVAELVLQLKIRDGLLSGASLADLPIALRVHRPLAPWSPSLLEITGRVPTREIRDGVVRLANRKVSRRRTGIRTVARVTIDPPVDRRALGTRSIGPAVTPRGTAPHVLIAEDDPPSLNGLEALLTGWGCQVETATDGQMALEKALALHPSLVITDVTMPRLNGLEVLAVLRKDCPETPVIILTGHGAVGPLPPAAEEGPYGYLEKPVEVPELRMLVTQALTR
jgi:CheY-like chemotaxis protein